VNDLSQIIAFSLDNGLTERILAAHVDDGTGHHPGCAW
jgi:hypothetical protein